MNASISSNRQHALMEQKSISQVQAYHLANFPAQSLLDDFSTKCVQECKWKFIPGQIDVYHFKKSSEMEDLFFHDVILKTGKYFLNFQVV